MKRRKVNINLIIKLLLIVLISAAVASVAIAVDTTADEDQNLLIQNDYLDPFTLNVVTSIGAAGTGYVPIKRPAILIPFRPVLRSPCRP